MKKKSRRWIILLILLVLAASGVGWWKYASTTKNVEPTGPATAQVIRRDFSSAVLATGAVKSQVGSEVKVGARISGKVIRLHANIGDFVKKGQVIAELEKEDLTARAEHNKAELAVAEARIEDVEARLKLAQAQLQRHKELIVSRAVSRNGFWVFSDTGGLLRNVSRITGSRPGAHRGFARGMILNRQKDDSPSL